MESPGTFRGYSPVSVPSSISSASIFPSPLCSMVDSMSPWIAGGQRRGGSTSRLDRFIPSRRNFDLDGARLALFAGNSPPAAYASPQGGSKVVTPMREEYNKRLAEGLRVNNSNDTPSRLLNFTQHETRARENQENFIESPPLPKRASRKIIRIIPTTADKILDAPDLIDDYYLNLLDWGPGNVIAVALESCVYLWNAESSEINMLMQCEDEEEYVTSVSWAGDGKHVAIGTSSAAVSLWDAETAAPLRNLPGHSARVSALAWNRDILSTGGRDSLIINHDVRQQHHCIGTLRGHNQEVCGLQWSPSGSQLASGGNDNRLNIWGGPSVTRAAFSLDAHCAAVKALAWCPWQANLLASGGGTADRTIKFWNTTTGALLNSVDTNSQVCALQWNRHERELLSSHGFSQNQLCLWRYPSMVKVAEFTGHTSRVLHMAQSPDGTSICSAAADETLRFWSCFSDKNSQASKMHGSASSKLRGVNIR